MGAGLGSDSQSSVLAISAPRPDPSKTTFPLSAGSFTPNPHPPPCTDSQKFDALLQFVGGERPSFQRVEDIALDLRQHSGIAATAAPEESDMLKELTRIGGVGEKCKIARGRYVKGASKVPGSDDGTIAIHRAFVPIGVHRGAASEDGLRDRSFVLSLNPYETPDDCGRSPHRTGDCLPEERSGKKLFTFHKRTRGPFVRDEKRTRTGIFLP